MLDGTEKCSWVITATKDAPSFRVISQASYVSLVVAAGYDLHYVEYGNSAVKESGSGSTTAWLKFDDTTSANTVIGTKYSKTEFYGQEYPDVYVVVNPSALPAGQKKRWFPA